MRGNLHFAMLAEGELPQPSADRVVGSCRSLFQGTFRARKALQQKDAQPSGIHRRLKAETPWKTGAKNGEGRMESVIDRCLGEGGMQWRSSGRSRP